MRNNQTKSNPGNIAGNSGMVYFADKNQAPSFYSMHTGRIATTKFCQETVSDTCKQHWFWGEGDWSQNLFEVL